MVTKNYTGMGPSFIVHDAFAVETAGPIHDRTKELLGTTDIIVVQARRQLLAGIEAVREGKDPAHVIRDERDDDMSDLVVVSEVVPATTNHRTYWKDKHVCKPTLMAGE
jgi:hypothetical protein